MNFNEIVSHIESKSDYKCTVEDGKDVVFIDSENWKKIAEILKNDSKLSFDYLMCISSYDNGDKKTYGVAYNFYSISKQHYLEVRVEVEDQLSVPSIALLWRTADWHEREAFDMMGILFEGHPNMKRILLSEDWEGHPLRKDYKEPDYYHGMSVPKDKSYWE